MATSTNLHFQNFICCNVQVKDQNSSITHHPLVFMVPLRNTRPLNLKFISCKKSQSLKLPECCVGSASSLLQVNKISSNEDEIAALNKRAKEVSLDLKGTSIFLVGMMGCGKTTVGKVLADALGYYFFDSDSVVEQAAGGASVATIFSENGEESFRDAESQALEQLSSMVRLVVSTGGGSVIRPSNWGKMRNGVTVWLNVPVEALAKRVSDIGIQSRPILANGSDYENDYEETYRKLSAIFEERQKLYMPADAHVSLNDIASETGIDVCQISPYRIALQVLDEMDVLIQRRKMQDNSRLCHHQ